MCNTALVKGNLAENGETSRKESTQLIAAS